MESFLLLSNVFIKQKMTYRYQEQSCDCQDDGGNKYRDGVGRIREFGRDTHRLLLYQDGPANQVQNACVGSSNQVLYVAYL